MSNDPNWRDAAVLLVALDGVLCDDLSPENALARAYRLEAAVEDDPLWADGKHHGDCTKQPTTCIRCLVERTEDEARTIYELDLSQQTYTREQLLGGNAVEANARKQWERVRVRDANTRRRATDLVVWDHLSPEMQEQKLHEARQDIHSALRAIDKQKGNEHG